MSRVPGLLELVPALTLGLGAAMLVGQAEEQRMSVVLELLVSIYVCGSCGLGRGELTHSC